MKIIKSQTKSHFVFILCTHRRKHTHTHTQIGHTISVEIKISLVTIGTEMVGYRNFNFGYVIESLLLLTPPIQF